VSDDHNNISHGEASEKVLRNGIHTRSFTDLSFDSQVKSRSGSSADSKEMKLNPEVLTSHLDLSSKRVAEQVIELTSDELELRNNLLKPYIKQLSTLKASLASQLKELEDTKAYIALGMRFSR
jgi:hypothetical protein